MDRKYKNAGRGSQMIDKIKKKSEREERDSGSDTRSSEPSTSSSSYERYHPSGDHEKYSSSSSRERPYHGSSHEKLYPSKSYDRPHSSTSHEKSYHKSHDRHSTSSHEKSYSSSSHDRSHHSTSHERPYSSSSHERHDRPSHEKSYASTSRDKHHRREHEESKDTEPGPSRESEKESGTIGRGKFLTLLAEQSKFKSSKEPEESKEPPAQFKRCKDFKIPKIFSTKTSEEAEPAAPIVKMGETGAKIKMQCNYISLNTTPGKGIFEYEVNFEPPVPDIKNRFKLINKCNLSIKGVQCYDGVQKLFLPDADKKEIVVEGSNPLDGTPITITAVYKRKVRSDECGSFYNVLLSNCAKILNLTRLGRHHYDSSANHFIPQHKLEVWPGYVTSVEEFEGGIHLCCDVKHRILRTDTAYDVLGQVSRADPRNFRNKAVKELLGQCVLTRYNNHMYRIDDIAWNENPLSTFSAKGKTVSYVEYYKTQYNITIKDVRQPLLLHIPRKKGNNQQICLIPELSYMTGLTDAMRRDMKVMKEVAAYTRVTPAQREYSLKKFVDNINNSSAALELLRNWGLTIRRDPVTVEGRILPPEDIIFKNEIIESSDSADWLKILLRQGVVRSVDIVNWIIVYSARDKRLADSLVRAIKEVGPSLGIRIDEPQHVTLRDDKIESYIKGLKDNIRQKTQIVMCLCGTPREDRYSAIKKYCCLEMPIPSQIVNCGSVSRENRLRVVAQNIALQMNNKLGGASWAMNVPLKNCMICGIDTYHDTEKRGNSIGAFVASLDSKYTHWFSQVCIQEPGQELLHGLVVCFAAALQKYHSINKKLPDRIVIFRDGVGDGQLRATQKVEVQQFLDACKLAEGYEPKFSFVVVQKRINTKFYIRKRDNLENPMPGSILDHTITRRNYYDFFLISQYVSCGTATPSHYIVLYDNSDLKPDYMQRLTYKFCHMYFNWPGTIRVPAPCQYAHKLAYLVGQNIKKDFDGILKDKLFYL